ncbi:MAG TPA: PVC-type heme-binding CxxCH protein [Verrucomicrobiales bacterium]|nr:PVC-type heme-binding CxxCH protein [Verrucomicrobiales bacterium]
MSVDAISCVSLAAIAVLWGGPFSALGAENGVDQELLSSFEHHAGIGIQLFAREPDVVDPVALCFSANGDCFVVEMRDYPYGFGPERKPGGTLRLLRDRDGDGRADESHLFAEDLSFPTSVTPWRNGVLVMEPPRITFLADTDGDDRADVREVILDGLGLGVTDSNANGLRWGPDCRLHAANGGNGGSLTSPLRSGEVLHLENADFTFDPDTGAAERSFQTSGGFGLVFHDWGQSFATYNINYLQQRIVPLSSLAGQPQLPSIDVTRNISAHGESARIFPIVQAVTRVNHPEQAGHFSSAGGMGILVNSPLFAGLEDSVFVCDVVCNIVHRDLLLEDGPIFRGQRAPGEEEREFISSRDPAFRPLGLEHGPDGALYLPDMQRDVIEHPDYIPSKVLRNMDIRAGQDRGRIYRIVPAGGGALSREPLEGQETSALAVLLTSAKPWVRLTAQRLLFEQRSEDSAALIRAHAMEGGPPCAKVLALHLLHRLGALRSEDLDRAYRDPHPGVRENAVRLAESLLPVRGAARVILEGAGDPHARVRFQAALSLSKVPGAESLEALRQIMITGAGDGWSRFAVLSASRNRAADLLGILLRHALEEPPEATARLTSAIRELTAVAAAEDTTSAAAVVTRTLEAMAAPGGVLVAPALVEGIRDGWKRRPSSQLPAGLVAPLLIAGDELEMPSLVPALLELARLTGLDLPPRLRAAVDDALRLAASGQASIETRIAALDVLDRLPAEEAFPFVSPILTEAVPAGLQNRALDALGTLRHPETATFLLRHWKHLSPTLRPAAVRLLLSRTPYHTSLLDALERGDVRVSELNLDLEQRRTLLRWSSPAIAERAAHFFGDEEYGNRKEAVEEWLAALPPAGDVKAGAAVFDARCAACHQAAGRGQPVGPDLTGVWHRSVEDLLSHIIDPNMAIDPGYVACIVETHSDDVHMGLLAEDTADAVTLVLTGGARTTVPRSTIRTFRTLETSLMPEGLELGLTPEEMRSLIAFLQERPPD